MKAIIHKRPFLGPPEQLLADRNVTVQMCLDLIYLFEICSNLFIFYKEVVIRLFAQENMILIMLHSNTIFMVHTFVLCRYWMKENETNIITVVNWSVKTDQT